MIRCASQWCVIKALSHHKPSSCTYNTNLKVCINKLQFRLSQTNMVEQLSALTNAEKLERRRAQLAKWKSKKALGESSPVPPDTQKQDPQECAGSQDSVTADAKKLERLRKLQEWKRKKQQADEGAPIKLQKILKPTAAPAQTKPSIRITARKRPLSAKRSDVFEGFAEENDTPEGPKFKVPHVGQRSKDDSAAEESNGASDDELEEYLKALESDASQPLLETSVIPVREDDVVDDEPESDDDLKLISSRMKNFQAEKELNEVDHSALQYASFNKQFYVEAQSVMALTEAEVTALRLELDGIKVSGANPPRPIWLFEQLGLPKASLLVIEEKLHYSKPTAIQCQALPAIMSGRDFLGIAKTGLGKTLAFVLPLIRHVQDQPPLANGDGPISVILTPTRELAIQIFKQLSQFTKRVGLSACCCYGGSSIEPQIAELKKGSQIVVATPGRLIDLLAANNGRVCNLRRVTYVVLDEADRMFDIGFEPQVRKIISQIRPDRQCVLFSATFAKKMESLARSILTEPVEVIVGGVSVVAPEITQKVEYFELTGSETNDEVLARKFEKLLEVLSSYPAVKKLVFVETQALADELLVKLLQKNVVCVTIHGGKDQIDRKHAIREFSSTKTGVDVLIATSVAARGLDVKGLDLVINFDPASHMEDYVHRVGRTGRAGSTGDAYTFVTSAQERAIADLVKALRLSKIPDDSIDPRLIDLTNKFMDKVKHGKEKYRFGFGGNGLQKLEEIRNTSHAMERSAFNSEPSSKSEAAPEKNGNSRAELVDKDLDLPEFNVIEGRAEETSGPDKCKFHSRIVINDLPQKARWTVVSADNLAQIIESTSTSITNKGQFYPPKTRIPTTIKQGGKEIPAPPKLYLLIEGLTEKSVSDANRMIRQKMIEGLDMAARDESVSVTGRYTV